MRLLYINNVKERNKTTRSPQCSSATTTKPLGPSLTPADTSASLKCSNQSLPPKPQLPDGTRSGLRLITPRTLSRVSKTSARSNQWSNQSTSWVAQHSKNHSILLVSSHRQTKRTGACNKQKCGSFQRTPTLYHFLTNRKTICQCQTFNHIRSAFNSKTPSQCSTRPQMHHWTFATVTSIQTHPGTSKKPECIQVRPATGTSQKTVTNTANAQHGTNKPKQWRLTGNAQLANTTT